MLFAIIESKNALTNDVITTFHSYNNYSELITESFSPESITVWLLDTDTPPKGKTYNIKKSRLRSKAINYNNIIGGINNGVSMLELSLIQDYFTRYGKRYGLLKEFNENGII
jgi:hypothetical protein